MRPDELTAQLARLGIARADTVMVHASLRRIGTVEGGADGVIDAITSAVGPEGTMLMVLGALDDRAWVNDRPEPERMEHLARAVPSTPSRPPPIRMWGRWPRCSAPHPGRW